MLEETESFDQVPAKVLSADELCDEGTKFYLQKRPDVARMYFDAALLKDPDHARSLQNLSSSLLQGNLLNAALSTAKKALHFGTELDKLGVMMNVSAAQNGLGQFEEVLTSTDKIIRLMLETDKRIAGVWHNRGLVLNHLERLSEAIGSYDKALSLCNMPEHRNLILSDRALALLGLGRIAEATEVYQVRWENRLHKCKVWELGIPEWKGESLKDKKIILVHEQGFGDGIMLVRMVPNLLELGAKVVIACPNHLIDLFTSHVSWENVPVEEWDDVEKLKPHQADYFVPMLTALGRLGLDTETISDEPYLHAEPDEASLGPKGYRIGLCWASGFHSFALNIRRRYAPLDLFFPLAEIPGTRLVSLQKDDPAKDILNMGAESFIHDPMPKCEDFADTAKIIAGLDLVISVDSAIAHLAGAMGVPCLMLGPMVRCWRWWGGSSGWPWYQNFQIFQQTKWGDWEDPAKRVVSLVRFLRLGQNKIRSVA